MSGGHFEYQQYRINDIVQSIKEIIREQEKLKETIARDGKYVDEYGYESGEEVLYSKETIGEFRRGMELLEKGAIYAQRIDWLVCGDDGEDSFHERLKQDLNELTPQAQE